LDPVTEATVGTAAQAAAEGAQAVTHFSGALDAGTVLSMLNQAWLTTYPMAVASVLALAVIFERWYRYRGLESATRDLTRRLVDLLVKRDVSAARALCEASKTPIGAIFLEGLRWKNIALEDLQSVLATSRQETITNLRRGLWVLGTIGSLAPFVGLFGTVIGIMRAFHQMATEGSGGFAVVAAGISEALIATAAGLGVAIFALGFYNYLQVRAGNVANVFARACERFVQALLYVESGAPAGQTNGGGESRGHSLPA
jgi:biopolymer transport protein ExbB